MFTHILLATDLTTSERAVETAGALASKFGARLTVVHVYQTSAFVAAASAMTGADLMGPSTDTRDPDLERVVWRLRGKGVRAKSLLRCGVAWEQIVDVAREVAADLIVTGTHQRLGFPYMFRRSVAEKVLEEAQVPVLAVPHRASQRAVDGAASEDASGT